MACQSTPSPEVTFAAGCIELFLPVAVPSQRPLGRSPGARQPPCGVRHRALSGGLWIPPAFRLPAFASCAFLRAVELALSCDGVTGACQTTTGLPRSA